MSTDDRINQTNPIVNHILVEGGTIYTVNEELTLYNAQDMDSGQYLCQAKNEDGDVANQEFELYVRGLQTDVSLKNK